MCDDLVERVAEAIRLRSIERGNPIHPLMVRHLTVAALAAIEAAGYVVVPREPTPEMRLAGGMAWMKSYVDLNSADPIADACFKAMIQTALEKDKANVG